MKVTRLFAGFAVLSLGLAPLSANASDSEALARQLLNSQGCKGCHLFEGSGGSLGPALDDVGKRLNQEQIATRLQNPKASNANSIMPAFGHLKPEELKALSEFLASRK